MKRDEGGDEKQLFKSVFLAYKSRGHYRELFTFRDDFAILIMNYRIIPIRNILSIARRNCNQFIMLSQDNNNNNIKLLHRIEVAIQIYTYRTEIELAGDIQF